VTRYCPDCGAPLITLNEETVHRGTGVVPCNAIGLFTEEREQDVLNASIALVNWFYDNRYTLSPELRTGPFLNLLDRADALLEAYDPNGPGVMADLGVRLDRPGRRRLDT